MAGISISLDIPTLTAITVEAELNDESISACAKRLICAALASPALLKAKRKRKDVEESTVAPGANKGIIVQVDGTITHAGDKPAYQVVHCYNDYTEYDEKKCGRLADGYCAASCGICPFNYVQPLFSDE